MVVPGIGSGNVGNGTGGGGDVFPPPSENHQPVYCDLYDTGDMSGGGSATGIASSMEMLVSGGFRLGGDEGGGGGNGGGGRGGCGGGGEEGRFRNR